jgi:hypothetical protein
MCCGNMSVPLKDDDSERGSPAKAPLDRPGFMVFAQRIAGRTEDFGLSASEFVASALSPSYGGRAPARHDVFSANADSQSRAFKTMSNGACNAGIELINP